MPDKLILIVDNKLSPFNKTNIFKSSFAVLVIKLTFSGEILDKTLTISLVKLITSVIPALAPTLSRVITNC